MSAPGALTRSAFRRLWLDSAEVMRPVWVEHWWLFAAAAAGLLVVVATASLEVERGGIGEECRRDGTCLGALVCRREEVAKFYQESRVGEFRCLTKESSP